MKDMTNLYKKQMNLINEFTLPYMNLINVKGIIIIKTCTTIPSALQIWMCEFGSWRYIHLNVQQTLYKVITEILDINIAWSVRKLAAICYIQDCQKMYLALNSNKPHEWENSYVTSYPSFTNQPTNYTHFSRKYQ